MYILSRASNQGLRQLEATNLMADFFELLGIYQEYIDKESDDEKSYDKLCEFYNSKKGTTTHHYRNIGEIEIKKLIFIRREIEIPRYIFRMFSQTWKGVPIISHQTMGEMFDVVLERITESELLRKIVCEIVLKERKDDIVDTLLYFQYEFVSEYAYDAKSIKKRKMARELNRRWRENYNLRKLC